MKMCMTLGQVVRCAQCGSAISKLMLHCPVCDARTQTGIDEKRRRDKIARNRSIIRWTFVLLVAATVATMVYTALQIAPQQRAAPDATKSVPM